ncbi:MULTISPECIES: protein NO VEIN domain-containing protein [Protofrankia]|uniref:protein NO VEIN domain-containing protein n=1 Tax=Protofrankia TaxID=2994361 RepID=UPI0012F85FA9
MREAIERRAVDTVITKFTSRGYSVTDVGSIRSWDVEAHRGDETVHIEVKGSATRREAVELTDNEVRHAEDYPDSVLVVVDDISWSRTEDGHIVASGGTWREWSPWTPSRSDLLATRYCYVLPKT